MNKEEEVDIVLPVATIVTAALIFLKTNLKIFLRTLLLVSIANVSLLSNIPKNVSSDNLLLYSVIVLAALITYPVFAVTVHRITILGQEAVPKFGYFYFTLREIHFGILLILVSWLAGALSSLPFTLVNFISHLIFDIRIKDDSLYAFMALPFFYLFGRFSLVFPAVAINGAGDIKWAWKISQGNGWRLAVLTGLIPWILTAGYGLLAHLSDSLLYVVFAKILFLVLFLFEVLLLSFSFKVLCLDPDET